MSQNRCIEVISAKDATLISKQELSVHEIRKRLFENIYSAAISGCFSTSHIFANKLPGGIPQELVKLGYQVVCYKTLDDDNNELYEYYIYWGDDVFANYREVMH